MACYNPFMKIDRTHLSAGAVIKDITGGIIVALVSIPISMGYAQISGLPVQYGLYASLIPILIYAFFTSTRNFVFGVDAAPAVLVGAALTSIGVEAGSDDALITVPVITFMVTFWLLLFYVLKAGRAVRYISKPVMAGFVTGICLTIILMQIPKLYGSTSGTGEGYELIRHIIDTAPDTDPLSLTLGVSTVALIIIMKHLLPKFPTQVIIMIAGFLLTVFFNVDDHGVALLPHVDSGLPRLVRPDFVSPPLVKLLFPTLTVAIVIMSETLLASGSIELREGRRMDNNREILGYGLGNLASAVVGGCPVNGSVSRSSLARQYGVTSQVMSVAASATMVLVLLFLTPIIEYLPVPMLTGIVVAALISACEFDVAHELLKTNRNEFYIFLSACMGVLIFGTIYGVIIGVILSFLAVIIRAVVPPREFVGIIPGREGFYSLSRYRDARPVKDTVIYRFGGNLFFANIDTFEADILGAVKDNTHTVIIYAASIGDIDVTAAERLVLLNKNLRERGIVLYMTDHVGAVNDKLRTSGARELLYNGTIRRTIRLALRDAGLHIPYPIEDGSSSASRSVDMPERIDDSHVQTARGELSTELEWIFGKDSEIILNKMSEEILMDLSAHITDSNIGAEVVEQAEYHATWGRIGLADEGKLLDLIEQHLDELTDASDSTREAILNSISERRKVRRRKLTEGQV